MELFKYYVSVVTRIDTDGQMTPLVLEWENKHYRIIHVISIRETYSRAGGCGICYECQFKDKKRNLFWEKYRWFIESPVFIKIE